MIRSSGAPYSGWFYHRIACTKWKGKIAHLSDAVQWLCGMACASEQQQTVKGALVTGCQCKNLAKISTAIYLSIEKIFRPNKPLAEKRRERESEINENQNKTQKWAAKRSLIQDIFNWIIIMSRPPKTNYINTRVARIVSIARNFTDWSLRRQIYFDCLNLHFI